VACREIGGVEWSGQRANRYESNYTARVGYGTDGFYA